MEKPGVAGNRVVAERSLKYAQALHRNNVEQMRPVLNSNAPPVLPHLVERRKRDQLAQGTLLRPILPSFLPALHRFCVLSRLVGYSAD